jgi:hypothetical protein
LTSQQAGASRLSALKNNLLIAVQIGGGQPAVKEDATLSAVRVFGNVVVSIDTRIRSTPVCPKNWLSTLLSTSWK